MFYNVYLGDLPFVYTHTRRTRTRTKPTRAAPQNTFFFSFSFSRMARVYLQLAGVVVGIDDELLGGTLVEVGVAARRVVQRDDLPRRAVRSTPRM